MPGTKVHELLLPCETVQLLCRISKLWALAATLTHSGLGSLYVAATTRSRRRGVCVLLDRWSHSLSTHPSSREAAAACGRERRDTCLTVLSNLNKDLTRRSLQHSQGSPGSGCHQLGERTQIRQRVATIATFCYILCSTLVVVSQSYSARFAA